MTEVVFWSFSGAAIVAAFLCVTRRSPVAAALWLIVTLFSIAALFVVLDAQFIAALQVLVYAGAIMVLFLFVIMLLNLGRGGPSDLRGAWGKLVAAGLGAVLVVELWAVRAVAPADHLQLPPGAMARMSEERGPVGVITDALFREYLIPFEITSMLLLAAIVGAVVLAKRRL
ncbi:MAG: NADH-quinone oxidoreductase subunit J [Gemmatimonadetes bacterium]|jgi:NADH-quinone oxidoreductase subunit J|nr:NADH-quinone oxidoreductase subunit J [Gemmatimonadota bacterium]